MPADTVAASGTTPGAGDRTLNQIADDIAQLFGLDGDPKKVALCKHMVWDVLDDLNRKKLWRFNLIASDTITSTAGVGTLTMPANIFKLYQTRKTSGVDYTLDTLREHTANILFTSQSGITGFPYAQIDFNLYRDGTIRLFPVPDAAYDFVVRYFQLIGKPGDAEFLDMPRPYQTVPKYGACARIAAMFDKGALTYWEGKFQEAYGEMNAMDEDTGDEFLRFINIEELSGRTSYTNPAARPRFIDLY
jgi:hypothetical protein